MIYGFNENKEKVEIVVVRESVTVAQGNPRGFGRISGAKLASDYGMTDLSKYVLVGWSYSTSSNAHDQTTPHYVEADNHTDPYIEFDTRNNIPNDNGIIIWGYQPSGTYTYNVNVVFLKVA